MPDQSTLLPSPERGTSAGPVSGRLIGAAAVAAALAVAVAVGILAITGALVPVTPAIFDPGALVRWGLPTVRTLHDLAAAATIGLLVVGTFLVPPDRGTDKVVLDGARQAMVRAGAVAARCWFALAAGVALLSAADATGSSLAAPGFLTLASSFWTQTELGQTLIAVCVGSASAAIGATVARTVVGSAWAAGFALATLAPLALGGHAAGSLDHGNSVDSLLLHLVGVCLWVGGLVAVLGAARMLGDRLPVVAARYSTLAGWSFALVAMSGVVNAYLRLGGLDNLASTYGLLVIGKTTALLVLGTAGWLHRRATIPGLATGPTRAHWFARLATGEVLVMAATMGLAVALSRSAPPVDPVVADPATSLLGYAPPPAISVVNWLVHGYPSVLWLTVCALLIGLYVAGVVKLRRGGNAWPVHRTVLWVLGGLLLAFLTSGGAAVYGRLSFSAHMIQHMALMVPAPLLLVGGAPITLALRALSARPDGSFGPREVLLALVHARFLGIIGQPVVAAVIFTGSLIVFYYTSLFSTAMFTHLGHVLMTVHFLLAGYLFIWSLVGIDPGPQRPSYPIRLVVLLVTMAFHAFFGLSLMQSAALIGPDWWHALGQTDDAALLIDQQLGGGIAWGAGDIPALLIGLTLIVQWVRSDSKESRRRDRQADRDDDAELKAYNEKLAALAKKDAQR
ncbi:MAG TPA: cytochrome c oxidase assembly protein [Microlunatus sp.]|nr:cytochrome c oxidase assembly protein [Microlunatus sp.]